MSLPVSVEEVAGELQLLNELMYAYLNRRTGALIILTDDEIRRVQQATEDADLLEWEQEQLPKIREVVNSENWLELPSKWEIHDYRIMERFCYSVEQDDDREQLLRAIRGRGAFRYFRDTVERLERLDDWYAYRDQAYEDIAEAWLEEHGIPFVKNAEQAG